MQAAVYVRISLDQAGQGLGVQRQEALCRELAARKGWTVTEVYADNDVSASSTKPRPAYERLLTDLEAGTVNAVVVYAVDRLTRRPAELETFIYLVERKGVALANVTGEIDLSTPMGRLTARIQGSVARGEVEKLAERMKAQKAQRAAAGKPQGTRYRVYGYQRDWTVRPDEAAVVREVFERRAAGESIGSITSDLQARDIHTATGGQWRPQNTSRALQQPLYAGLATYRGTVVGKSEVEALVDEVTWQACQRTDGPKAGDNTRRYLLSGILVCDECKAPMTGWSIGQGHRYRCDPHQGGCGSVSIKGSWVDEFVLRFVRGCLIRERPTTTEDTTGADIAALDAEIEHLRAAEQAGDLDLADLLPMLKERRARRNALVRQAVAVPPVTMFTSGDAFMAAPLSAQRAEVSAWLSAVLVKRGPRGARSLDVSRLSGVAGPKRPYGDFDYMDGDAMDFEHVDEFRAAFDR